MRNIIRNFLNIFSSKDKDLLTVIGVGPGDPALLTIAASKAIKKANIIFYPISGQDKKSLALEIVKEHIKFQELFPIIFPMGRKEFNSDQVWENAASKIVGKVKINSPVVLLCLGDTSILSSSGYIVKKIKDSFPEIQVKNIPGISSFSNASAMVNFQLLKNGEILEVLECPNNEKDLIKLIQKKKKSKGVLVIMKIGKKWIWVRNALKKEDVFDKSFLAVDIGMKNQFIGKASINESENLSYFSLILLRV